jgi:hypothetical protein
MSEFCDVCAYQYADAFGSKIQINYIYNIISYIMLILLCNTLISYRTGRSTGYVPVVKKAANIECINNGQLTDGKRIWSCRRSAQREAQTTS